MDIIAILTIITDNFRNLGIGLLVFSTNMMIQAVVSINQTQAATMTNQTILKDKFGRSAIWLFTGTGVMILIGILLYFKGLPGVTWITMGYTLFIVAGSCLTWYFKLKSTDQVKFGRTTLTTARWILGVAIALLGGYMIIQSAITLGFIR